MTMVRLLVLALLLFSNGAIAQMTGTEIAKEAAFASLVLVDYRQTLDIKNRPGLYEQNPVIGKHPSDARLRNFCLGTVVGHLAVSYFLPRPYKAYWQNITIVIETGFVSQNARLGLSVNF